MPNVTRALLITLTVNPQDFRDPESAFEYSRDRIRRMFFQLRKGVSWDGRVYDIDAPYWIKVEFHRSGFAHFHIIFLTRRFVPGRLLNHLWKVGRTNIRRIDSHGISYLLKYVTKGQNLPEWVKERKRLRITQASQGFYEKVGSTKLKKDSEKDCAIPRFRPHYLAPLKELCNRKFKSRFIAELEGNGSARAVGHQERVLVESLEVLNHDLLQMRGIVCGWE